MFTVGDCLFYGVDLLGVYVWVLVWIWYFHFARVFAGWVCTITDFVVVIWFECWFDVIYFGCFLVYV